MIKAIILNSVLIVRKNNDEFKNLNFKNIRQ